MEQQRFKEMLEKFHIIKNELYGKIVYLFGHCEATLTLADLLMDNGCMPFAILDNNEAKYGQNYKGIPVVFPSSVLDSVQENTVVLIATRFYEAMKEQICRLGFRGKIIKLVDYNTYAEYSLAEATRNRKKRRLLHGKSIINELRMRHRDVFLIFCPFNALGDIYFCMSYLPAFQKKRGFDKFVLCVPSKECRSVALLFGTENVTVMAQNELDAAIQYVIFSQDEHSFIAHQDRPYVVNLHKIMKMKKFPLEKIYCCGIFGLPEFTNPVKPSNWKDWDRLDEIDRGRAVIFSPYAKSVIMLSEKIWTDIVGVYSRKGYQLFTNVCGGEEPLVGTKALRAKFSEMRSIVEKAGTFIGIRSGLCDVIRTAQCRKIALYPDYNYCDTRWKAIDIYNINGFENIVVGNKFKWQID